MSAIQKIEEGAFLLMKAACVLVIICEILPFAYAYETAVANPTFEARGK